MLSYRSHMATKLVLGAMRRFKGVGADGGSCKRLGDRDESGQG